MKYFQALTAAAAASLLMACMGVSGASEATSEDRARDAEQVGDAQSADGVCPPGQQLIGGTRWCLVAPIEISHYPGAFGCIYGGAKGATGTIICWAQ
jgi:hypothetical protein